MVEVSTACAKFSLNKLSIYITISKLRRGLRCEYLDKMDEAIKGDENAIRHF